MPPDFVKQYEKGKSHIKSSSPNYDCCLLFCSSNIHTRIISQNISQLKCSTGRWNVREIKTKCSQKYRDKSPAKHLTRLPVGVENNQRVENVSTTARKIFFLARNSSQVWNSLFGKYKNLSSSKCLLSWFHYIPDPLDTTTDFKDPLTSLSRIIFLRILCNYIFEMERFLLICQA